MALKKQKIHCVQRYIRLICVKFKRNIYLLLLVQTLARPSLEEIFMDTKLLADSFLKTKLNALPLIDLHNFLIYFLKNTHNLVPFEFDLEFDADKSREKKIIDYVRTHALSLKNDNDFNLIEANDEYDYYLKVLRRMVTVEVFQINLAEFITIQLNNDIFDLDTIMDRTAVMFQHDDIAYEERLAPLDEEYKVLLQYENDMKDFSLTVIDCLTQNLDKDLEVHSQNAQTRVYPAQIKLRSCQQCIHVGFI
ncbi:MAG: hypothetical protein ACI9TY_001595 [Alphaproteobacteria bacterium]|jgi:hypothetical protein